MVITTPGHGTPPPHHIVRAMPPLEQPHRSWHYEPIVNRARGAICARPADNTPNRARTLAYIAQIAMRLLEVGDLEERLQQVEQALGPRLVRERKRR
jgi:hypothetical protein